MCKLFGPQKPDVAADTKSTAQQHRNIENNNYIEENYELVSYKRILYLN